MPLALRYVVLGALVLAGCSVDLGVPGGALITCSSDAECAAGLVCAIDVGRCLNPSAACVEPFAGGYRAAANGDSCQGDGIADGEGVCVAGQCLVSRCGDGVTDPAHGEGCDDGDANDDDAPDACRTTCAAPRCGDGVIDGNETCDDGNTEDGDACRATCVDNVCGDGVVYSGVEECDDGNPSSADACLPSCLTNVCGDGAINVGVETCEDFNTNENDGCGLCQLGTWRVRQTFGFGPWGGDPRRLGMTTPSHVVRDQLGNIYISEWGSDVVWRVDTGTDTIRAYAGGGQELADGIHALFASLSSPEGLAIDSRGNLLIAERFGRRVVRIDARTQILTVVAGSGDYCFAGGACGDGGPARSALFQEGASLALDASDNVFLVDESLGRVRRIDAITNVITAHFSITSPTGIAIDRNGVIYVAQDDTSTPSHRVRRYQGGVLSIFAGNGTACTTTTNAVNPCGDNGSATTAQLNRPADVAVSDDGSTVYISDRTDRRVRRVQGGIITTIAGTGTTCSSATCAEGIPASSTAFPGPVGLTTTPSGDLWIADDSLGRVRHLTPNGSGWIVTTTAGNQDVNPVYDGTAATASTWEETRAVAAAPGGVVFAVESSTLGVFKVTDGVLRRVSGQGPACAVANEPCVASDHSVFVQTGLAAMNDGSVVFYDLASQSVRRIDAAGALTTVAGDGSGATCDVAPYACGDNGPAGAARFQGVTHLAAADGRIYVSDPGARRIRVVQGGTITTAIGDGTVCPNANPCGDGGPAAAGALREVGALAVDSIGDLYFIDGVGPAARVRKIDRDTGDVSTVLTPSTSGLLGIAATPPADGRLFLIHDDYVYSYRPPSTAATVVIGGGPAHDGEPAANATVLTPTALSYSTEGDLYVADYEGATRRVDAAGIITTLIGQVDPLGTGPFEVARLQRPAQLTASLDPTRWLAADATVVHAIDLGRRRLDAVVGYGGGIIGGSAPARYAASFNSNAGITLDTAASPPVAFISDIVAIWRVVMNHPSDSRLWTLTAYTGGVQGHQDGGLGIARFDHPAGLAWDAARATLYVADSGNHVIRAITGTSVSTIAGVPLSPGGNLDLPEGIDADVARFNGPTAVTLDGDGNLLIADTGNHQVRRLDFATNRVHVVLGDGTLGNIGDGTPARAMPISTPRGLTFDGYGNLFVASGATLRQVLVGDDGVVDGNDTVRTLYGSHVANTLPESATRCLAGVALTPADDEVLLTDVCSGFFVHLQRAAAE